jgi:hypothetical protein
VIALLPLPDSLGLPWSAPPHGPAAVEATIGEAAQLAVDGTTRYAVVFAKSTLLEATVTSPTQPSADQFASRADVLITVADAVASEAILLPALRASHGQSAPAELLTLLSKIAMQTGLTHLAERSQDAPLALASNVNSKRLGSKLVDPGHATLIGIMAEAHHRSLVSPPIHGLRQRRSRFNGAPKGVRRRSRLQH